MSVTYDIDVRSLDDHYITVAESAAASIGATANAGSYLVDVLPICKSPVLSYSVVTVFTS